MKRTYECMVLLDNREVRQGWDAVKDSVATMLAKHNAEIVSSKLWEERRLAYPINHQQRGTYLLVYFNAPTNEITPINREMNMAGLVLRHSVIACEEVPESANEPEKEFDVSKIGIEETPKPEAQASEASKSDADAPKPEKSADEDAAEDTAKATTAEATTTEATTTEATAAEATEDAGEEAATPETPEQPDNAPAEGEE